MHSRRWTPPPRCSASSVRADTAPPPLLRRKVVTVATSVWRAMAGNPVRFVRSRWPWRSLAYVVSSVAVTSIAWLAILPLLLFPPLLLLVGIPIGAVERQRLGVMDPLAIPDDPHAP